MLYKMKNLGYPRTPTDALLLVEMPSGGGWYSVPVQVIADDRDRGDGAAIGGIGSEQKEPMIREYPNLAGKRTIRIG